MPRGRQKIRYLGEHFGNWAEEGGWKGEEKAKSQGPSLRRKSEEEKKRK